jgi:hypothetical protein
MEGNLLLLESRFRHWDRAVEVPERVLRPWEQRAARPDARPLDSLAELAAALDDLQTLGLSQYWGWYLEDPRAAALAGPGYPLYLPRHHLRFWATLTPAQREQALSGATVPADRMSEAQRRAFVTALTDPVADLEAPGAAFLLARRAITPADLLAGGFRLQSMEWRMQLFHGTSADGKTTQLTAMHPAYRPPVLSSLPPGHQWASMGDPTGLDRFTFAYHLAGEKEPVRSVELWALRTRNG